MHLGYGWKHWLILAAWLLAAAPFAAAQQPATATSTAANRVSLGITLYNSNFALVRETRRVSLPAGAVRLGFEGVPRTIEPETVHLGAPRGLDVLDQSYEYDLLSPQRLLEKYEGKEITLLLRGGPNGAGPEREVKALLLSTNGPVWKIGGDIVTGLQPVGYRFPALPGGLHTRPTLVWSLRNAAAGERRLSVSYLAGQMNWAANYVLDLSRDGRQGNLESWVTLTNNSGTSFENAQLSLVAGQVHRATGRRPGPVVVQALEAKSVAAGQFAQEPAGEYHLYRLKRPVTLLNAESKQISLLAAPSVPVTQTYLVEGTSGLFRMRIPERRPPHQPVKVYLSFRNDAAAGLGQPLPAGVVRVYQPDSQGNLQLLGEDRIDHTPKDEMVRLYVGNAFDITAERRQTDFRTLGSRVHESAFEITLRDHKPHAVTVEVREPVGGTWEVLESNFPAKKLDAFTLSFQVPVPANGAAKLTYRIRVTD
jgi:hypothetical protein